MLLLKQLALAATAAAFLVVPDVSQAEEDVFHILPADVENDYPPTAMNAAVSLPCRGCKRRHSYLDLEFAVEEGRRLTLNGFELYPTADPWNADLTAAAIIEGHHPEQGKDQRLGYSLTVKPEGTDEEQHLEIIAVELRVIEVGSLFVDDIPTVKVKLIQDPSGGILIGSVNLEEAEGSEARASWHHIMSKFDAIWRHIKHSGRWRCGRGKGHKKPGHAAINGDHSHDAPRPHHDYEHGHGHGHRGHNLGKLMKNIAANIILPVLTGITAGVGVAVFAMALCSCAALLFRARSKRCRRACRRSKVDAAKEIAINDDEKTGLMGAQDSPPQYEESEAAEVV